MTKSNNRVIIVLTLVVACGRIVAREEQVSLSQETHQTIKYVFISGIFLLFLYHKTKRIIYQWNRVVLTFPCSVGSNISRVNLQRIYALYSNTSPTTFFTSHNSDSQALHLAPINAPPRQSHSRSLLFFLFFDYKKIKWQNFLIINLTIVYKSVNKILFYF